MIMCDRTDVKNEQEVGALSVVSGINEAGKLKTSEAKEAQQASFLKFNDQDGLFRGILKQFNDLFCFWLYKVIASNVVQGVEKILFLQNLPSSISTTPKRGKARAKQSLKSNRAGE